MEGIIKVGAVFTAVSAITLLVYLRQKKPRSKLSFDLISILVYLLIAGFFIASYLLYFLA